MFANSITNMAGASYGCSAALPLSPVCFEKSSRFTIKKKQEIKKENPNRVARTRGTPFMCFSCTFIRLSHASPSEKESAVGGQSCHGIYSSVLVLKILANVH